MEDSEEFYLVSAELVERNLDQRIEQLFLLLKGKNREKVRLILELQLTDTANSWKLNADGTYTSLSRKGLG